MEIKTCGFGSQDEPEGKLFQMHFLSLIDQLFQFSLFNLESYKSPLINKLSIVNLYLCGLEVKMYV